MIRHHPRVNQLLVTHRSSIFGAAFILLRQCSPSHLPISCSALQLFAYNFLDCVVGGTGRVKKKNAPEIWTHPFPRWLDNDVKRGSAFDAPKTRRLDLALKRRHLYFRAKRVLNPSLLLPVKTGQYFITARFCLTQCLPWQPLGAQLKSRTVACVGRLKTSCTPVHVPSLKITHPKCKITYPSYVGSLKIMHLSCIELLKSCTPAVLGHCNYVLHSSFIGLLQIN